MTPQPLRSSYEGEQAAEAGGVELDQPGRPLRLFVSLPAYAAAERRRIAARLALLNDAFAGVLRFVPFGPGIESSAEDARGAADCDAVIAVLRPRFPDDPQVSDQSGGRGGAAGLVSAMGKGGAGGLPEVYIFRYAESAEQAAADSDWQSGKRAFDAWFRSRGGEVLAFDDFSTSDAFGEQLDLRLAAWLTQLGYEPPPFAAIEPAPAEQPVPEIAVHEAASVAEPMVVEPEPELPEPGEIIALAAVPEDEPEPELIDPEAELAEPAEIPALESATAAEPALVEPDPEFDQAQATAALEEVDEPEIVEPELEPEVAEARPVIEPAPEPFAPSPAHEESSEAVRRDRFRRLTSFLFRRQATYTQPEDTEASAFIAEIPLDEPTIDLGEVEPVMADLFGFEPEPAPPDEALEPSDLEDAGFGGEPADTDDGLTDDDDSALILEGEYIDLTEAGGDETSPPAAFLDELEPIPDSAATEYEETGLVSFDHAEEDDGALLLESTLVEPVAFLDAVEHESGLPEPAATPQTAPAPQIAAFAEPEPPPEVGGEEPAAVLEYPVPELAQDVQAEPVPVGSTAYDRASELDAIDAPQALPLAEAAGEFERESEPLPEPEVPAPAIEAPTEPERPPAPVSWEERVVSPKVVPLRPDRERSVDVPLARTGRGGRAAIAGMGVLTAVAAGFAIYAGLMWMNAKSSAVRAQNALAGATDSAADLVFNLNDEARRLGGATSEGSKAIVDGARKLHGVLLANAGVNTEDLFKRAYGKMEEGRALAKQNKLAEALKATMEGQRLFQTLVDLDPTQVEWQKRLGASDQKIGDVLSAQNNLTEALGAYRDDVAIRKMLSAADPDDVDRRIDLTAAQLKVGDVLAAKGRLEDALSIFRDAMSIRKTLAQSYSNNADRQRDLVEVDNKIADVLAAQGHLDEALSSYRDALTIMTKMSVMNPADPKWRDASAKTNVKIGDVLVGKGRIDDALASYRDGLATMKDVAANEPNNSEWQSSLALIHRRIGDAFVTETHFESALASYRDALAIVTAMLAKDPKSAFWRHETSEAQLRIGQVLFSQNNLDDALAAHRESLNIMKALAAEDPGNSLYQHDLMMGDTDIGVILSQKGVRAEAMAAYRDAQQIAATMGAKEPANSDWPTTRAMIDNNLGSLQMDAGNHDDGVAAYRDGVEVSKVLVARDPRNADWQSAYAVALYNLGEAGVDSETNFAQALDLLRRLDGAGALRPDKKALIPHVEDALAKMRGGNTRKRR
jgi:tetratricopeptide (TPR) repeat protein